MYNVWLAAAANQNVRTKDPFLDTVVLRTGEIKERGAEMFWAADEDPIVCDTLSCYHRSIKIIPSGRAFVVVLCVEFNYWCGDGGGVCDDETDD